MTARAGRTGFRVELAHMPSPRQELSKAQAYWSCKNVTQQAEQLMCRPGAGYE